MKNKYRLMPKSAACNNDYVIKCKHCHKQILIFGGSRKYIQCYNCNAKFRDKIYLENTVAYKHQKHIIDAE